MQRKPVRLLLLSHSELFDQVELRVMTGCVARRVVIDGRASGMISITFYME